MTCRANQLKMFLEIWFKLFNEQSGEAKHK